MVAWGGADCVSGAVCEAGEVLCMDRGIGRVVATTEDGPFLTEGAAERDDWTEGAGGWTE